MFVRPTNPAIKVPDPARLGDPPETYFLPLDGRDVGDDNATYWFRIIRDGDAEAVDPPPAP